MTTTSGNPSTFQPARSRPRASAWEMNTGYDLIEGYWLKYKYNSFEPYSTDYIENQKFIRGSDPAYKLTGLRPNVTYEVWITPKGMVHADMGEASEKITVTTETAAPAPM